MLQQGVWVQTAIGVAERAALGKLEKLTFKANYFVMFVGF